MRERRSGGNKTTAFEFVTMADLEQIIDGEVEVIGPDIDTVQPGAALPAKTRCVAACTEQNAKGICRRAWIRLP